MFVDKTQKQFPEETDDRNKYIFGRRERQNKMKTQICKYFDGGEQ